MKKRIVYNGYEQALEATSLRQLAKHRFRNPLRWLHLPWPKKENLPNLVVYRQPLECDFTPLAEILGNEPAIKKDFSRHALIHKRAQPAFQSLTEQLDVIIRDMKTLESLGWRGFRSPELRVVGHNTYEPKVYQFHVDGFRSRIMRNYTPIGKMKGLAHKHAIKATHPRYKPTVDAIPFYIDAGDFTHHAGYDAVGIQPFIHCAEDIEPEDPPRLVLVAG